MILEAIPKLDALPGGCHMVNAVDFVTNWARANSLWPLTYGTSCCAIEMMATGASHHDWSRFGMEVARATPRQADMIVLAGTLVEKMAERLITLYEHMPAPKYVVAMGSCTISGGPFYYDSYSVVKGADRVIPVDVFIPGCPPRPEALLYGLMELQKLIRKETVRRPRQFRPLVTVPAIDTWTATREAWDKAEAARVEATKAEREEFKKNNPEHKAWKAERVDKGEYAEVTRVPKPRLGLDRATLAGIVTAAFPQAELFNLGPATAENLAKLGAEEELDFAVPTDKYVDFVRFLKTDARLRLDFFIELTAVDWLDHFDIVVHLQSTRDGHKVFVRTSIPHENSEAPSLSAVYRGAEWHEREVYDFFGIRFAGHPDLRRLFLDDDFPGHPLRKDFSDPSRVVKRPY